MVLFTGPTKGLLALRLLGHFRQAVLASTKRPKTCLCDANRLGFSAPMRPHRPPWCSQVERTSFNHQELDRCSLPSSSPLTWNRHEGQHRASASSRDCRIPSTTRPICRPHMVDRDPRDTGRLVRGRHAKQTPGMGGMRLPACYHHISFSNLKLNGDMYVGESREVRRCDFFVPCWARWHLRRTSRNVINVGRRQEFICDCQVLLIPKLLLDATSNSLILFS
jgi:hypothetical protein